MPEFKIERADARDGADSAANGVGDIVVGAGRMVDAITPSPRGAALKAGQLIHLLRMVDQVDQLRRGGFPQRAIAAKLATWPCVKSSIQWRALAMVISRASRPSTLIGVL